MGMERGNHGAAATAGAQSTGYQRNSYHRNNYRTDSNYGGYGSSKFSHGGMQYDNGSKWDSGSKMDRSGSDQVNGVTGSNGAAGTAGNYQNGKSSPTSAAPAQNAAAQGSPAAQTASTGSSPKDQKDQVASPVTSIASLEKKLAATQAEMTQALQDSTSKENEKFDLIFSILIELQNRQGKLEESIKSLKAQFEPMGGCQPQLMAPVQGMAVQNGQGGSSPQAQMGGAMNSPMGGQVGMMAPQMGMMNGQMGMNQQMMGNTMMMMDGTGNMMTPVMVAMPQSGGQMQYVTQMMPQGVNMQAMPQQMVTFMANGQGGEGSGDMMFMQNMPMGGNMGGEASSANASTIAGGQSAASNGSGSGSSPDSDRSTGEQLPDAAGTQEATEQCKGELRIPDEE